MTATRMDDIDRMQRRCEQMPGHLRRTFLEGEAESGRLSLESSLETADLVWLCIFGKPDSFGVLHGEMIMGQRGAEEVAEVIDGEESIKVFLRIFGLKAVALLPEHIRSVAKRYSLEQDFSL